MSAPALQALIFDVDGTLADTEAAHLQAFNSAFADLGLDWRWDEALYTRLLDISGGKERIAHYWREVQPHMKALNGQAMQETIERIHELKTAYYEASVQSGGVHLRPGVLELIEDARRQGLLLAIATTTSPVNIAALLRKAVGPDWRLGFAAVGDASTAPVKKPNPAVYWQVLESLGIPGAACLAFEDSRNGLQAAHGAGVATIITPTRFTQHHDFSLALRVVPDLSHVSLEDLRAWRTTAQQQGATPPTKTKEVRQ